MSAGRRGLLVRPARFSAPVIAERVRWVSRRSRSLVTVRTTARADSRACSGITRLSDSRVPTRCTSGSTASSISGSSSSRVRPEPLDRVLLHDLHHADREERADVAEPAGHARGRARPGLTGAGARAPSARRSRSASYRAPSAASIRASSPSSDTPVPSARPPRRAPAASAAAARRGAALMTRPPSGARAQDRGDGPHRDRRPVLVQVVVGRRRPGPAAGRCRPGGPPCSPIARRSGGANSPKVRRSAGSTAAKASALSPASQPSARLSSLSSCSSSRPLPARNPSAQPAAAAAGAPADSSRDIRAAASSGPIRPASSSSRVSRPEISGGGRSAAASRASVSSQRSRLAPSREQPGGRVHGVDAVPHGPFGRLVQRRHRGRQAGADPGDQLDGHLAEPGRGRCRARRRTWPPGPARAARPSGG